MSIRDLQKTIKKNQGYIMSDGTLNPKHLLPKYYDLLNCYNIKSQKIKKEIEACFTPKKYKPTFYNQYYNNIQLANETIEDQEGISWILEKLSDFLNNIAPKGYYFGFSEGDGACIGFFRYEDEY